MEEFIALAVVCLVIWLLFDIRSRLPRPALGNRDYETPICKEGFVFILDHWNIDRFQFGYRDGWEVGSAVYLSGRTVPDNEPREESVIGVREKMELKLVPSLEPLRRSRLGNAPVHDGKFSGTVYAVLPLEVIRTLVEELRTNSQRVIEVGIAEDPKQSRDAKTSYGVYHLEIEEDEWWFKEAGKRIASKVQP